MLNRLARLTLVFVTVFALLLSGCGSSQEASDQAGLKVSYLPHHTPVYIVDLTEYLAAHPEASGPQVRFTLADFSGSGYSRANALFIFDKPIQDCSFLHIPVQFGFDGTKDASDTQWGSFLLYGSPSESIRQSDDGYAEYAPDHFVHAGEDFQLTEENEGLFAMEAIIPIDICAVTVLPTTASNGLEPYTITLDISNAQVGFPTEKGRQAFLDSLSR